MKKPSHMSEAGLNAGWQPSSSCWWPRVPPWRPASAATWSLVPDCRRRGGRPSADTGQPVRRRSNLRCIGVVQADKQVAGCGTLGRTPAQDVEFCKCCSLGACRHRLLGLHTALSRLWAAWGASLGLLPAWSLGWELGGAMPRLLAQLRTWRSGRRGPARRPGAGTPGRPSAPPTRT